MAGWIKVYRRMLDDPIVCKDSDYIAVWMYLLLEATHKNIDALFRNEKITLSPGQLITGRKSISKKFNISESKVQRILKTFENEHQIEQQTSNQNRLITIVKWEEYQQTEQQSEQQVNNKRTTDEQRMNTNKNVKNVKNERNINIVSKDTISSTDLLPIIRAWNDTGAPEVKSISANSNRYKLLKARIKEHGELEVIKAIKSIKHSPFLKGENNRNWIITFDWFIKPSNFIKVMEGNYLEKTNKGGLDNGKHERAVNETDWDRREIEKARKLVEQQGFADYSDIDF